MLIQVRQASGSIWVNTDHIVSLADSGDNTQIRTTGTTPIIIIEQLGHFIERLRRNGVSIGGY
jgi:hypothetical protein